jgi:hypothetical protein
VDKCGEQQKAWLEQWLSTSNKHDCVDQHLKPSNIMWRLEINIEVNHGVFKLFFSSSNSAPLNADRPIYIREI